jgi:acyl carrier protein
MTKAEILQGVREVLVRQFLIQPQSVTRDTSAYDIDGWDSVAHVYVVLDIERRFGVKLPEQRVFELENVGALVDLVAEMRSTA